MNLTATTKRISKTTPQVSGTKSTTKSSPVETVAGVGPGLGAVVVATGAAGDTGVGWTIEGLTVGCTATGVAWLGDVGCDDLACGCPIVASPRSRIIQASTSLKVMPKVGDWAPFAASAV
jgi:hypothetical protein